MTPNDRMRINSSGSPMSAVNDDSVFEEVVKEKTLPMQIRIDPFEGCPSGEHEVRVQFECHDAEGARDSVLTC